MAGIRSVLLAVIGVLTGAWVGLDLLKSGAKKAARSAVEPPKPASPTVAGAKGGAVALPQKRWGLPEIQRKDTGSAPAGREEKSDQKPESAPGAKGEHHDIREVHGPISYLKELYHRFNADHCPAWAAALSFFVFLSIVPILLVGLAAVGFLIQDPARAADQVTVFLSSLLPGIDSEQIERMIASANVAEHARELMDASSIVGIIGLLSLVWAATRIFVNAAVPMNAAFDVKETRGFLKMQMMAFGLFLAAGLLFLLSFIPSSGAALINRLSFGLFEVPTPTPFLLNALFFLMAIAFNAAMYTVIYRWLPSPSAGVRWRDAAVGGVTVAVLWEAAKQGFAWYLRNFGGKSYSELYGAVAGLFIAVIWVYYSSMILLLGAEIVEMYRDRQEAKTEAPA